jgi:hypothetical protein
VEEEQTTGGGLRHGGEECPRRPAQGGEECRRRQEESQQTTSSRYTYTLTQGTHILSLASACSIKLSSNQLSEISSPLSTLH